MSKGAQYWRINIGKISIPFWAILMFIFAIVLLASILYLLWVNSQPVQTAQVTVVSKKTKDRYSSGGGGMAKHKYPSYFVTFGFPDGSEKDFYVNPRGRATESKYEVFTEFFNNLQEGDTGTLTYKETKNAKDYGQRRFISFEKDEQ